MQLEDWSYVEMFIDYDDFERSLRRLHFDRFKDYREYLKFVDEMYLAKIDAECQ